MSKPGWRIDPIGERRLAWLYVRPHAVDWSDIAAEVGAGGYTVTEERQNLVDDGMGACIRYLVIKT